MKKSATFWKQVEQPKPTDIFIDPIKRETGELIETRLARIVSLKEPITESSPYIETPAGDGVIAEFNVRTDKFDQALETVTKMYESKNKVDAQRFQQDISDNLAGGNTEDEKKE